MAEPIDFSILERGLNVSSSPEAIQAYIDIATRFLTSVFTNRGFTEEQWREHYKSVIADEREFIRQERERLRGGTDPLPV